MHVKLYSCIDTTLDQAITPDSDQYIVWATGPRGPEDGFAYFHTSWPRDRQGRLRFGRTPADNCPALSCPTPPSCPFAQETFDVRNMNATFVAEIGQSGGPRGYEGLTGMHSNDRPTNTTAHWSCPQMCLAPFFLACTQLNGYFLEHSRSKDRFQRRSMSLYHIMYTAVHQSTQPLYTLNTFACPLCPILFTAQI